MTISRPSSFPPVKTSLQALPSAEYNSSVGPTGWLQYLDQEVTKIEGFTSSNINNASLVSGTHISDALNTLGTGILGEQTRAEEAEALLTPLTTFNKIGVLASSSAQILKTYALTNDTITSITSLNNPNSFFFTTGDQVIIFPYPTGEGLNMANVHVLSCCMQLSSSPAGGFVSGNVLDGGTWCSELLYDANNVYLKLGTGTYPLNFARVLLYKLG